MNSTYNETETRTTGEIALNVFFVLLTLGALGLMGMMAYGMVLDNASFMLPFPIVLSIPAVALVNFTLTNLITGNAVNTFKRIFEIA